MVLPQDNFLKNKITEIKITRTSAIDIFFIGNDVSLLCSLLFMRPLIINPSLIEKYLLL